MIHRDLKTENIIVTPQNTIKIIDFGLSKNAYHINDDFSAKPGSPFYMAPEVI